MLSQRLTNQLAALGLAALAIFTLDGCDNGIDCTAESRRSLGLTVIDAQTQAPVVDPVITFTIDGGNVQSPEAEVGVDGSYTIGRDTAGTFAVTVTAPGYAPAMETYEVEEDECHVLPITATIELDPVAP